MGGGLRKIIKITNKKYEQAANSPYIGQQPFHWPAPESRGSREDIHLSKNWSRSETLALAKTSCTHCHGDGLRPGRGDKSSACNCVLRAIFRACYARFRYCVTKEKYMSKVTLTFCAGKDRRLTWVRKDEDYVADFCLVSRRTLDDFEYKVFRYHFLLGADWRLCCRQMKIDRGTFFHAVYRVEQQLGRIFRDLEPYSLYPLDEYFGGTIRKASPPSTAVVTELPKPPVAPPLLKIA